ncbi:MAG: TIGR04211 family SH3 domain-containing protein [Porticoccaceae bacterium]|jgi:SH3 domain protein|nr:TIGR04211 family SH3 domain-containing protein [Porticoccaceae bacterium]
MHAFRIRFLTALFLATWSFLASAETRFISDELRVPLRKSPCSSCTIIHQGLVAGTKLELETSENDWALVTTATGLKGWLPLQYLVTNPIAKERLSAAEANTRMLVEDNDQLKARVAELEAANSHIEQQYSELQNHSSEIESELATIKKLSANALTLQEQNESLVKENRILQSEVDVLTATRDQLVSNNSQKWFIYGGIAVFLGALLSILIPQLKPKRRFSEWN